MRSVVNADASSTQAIQPQKHLWGPSSHVWGNTPLKSQSIEFVFNFNLNSVPIFYILIQHEQYRDVTPRGMGKNTTSMDVDE